MATAWVLAIAALVALGADVARARSYDVGDKQGWVENRRYSEWAAKHRFHVNDWLVFSYRRGEDSVVQVTPENYQRCNVTSPLKYMGSGRSVFVLDKSGAFFFASGEKEHCEKGQKMEVVVMAERKPGTPPSPSPSSQHHSSSPSPSPTASVKRSPVPSPSPDFIPPPSMEDESPSPSPGNQKSAATRVGSTHSLPKVLFALFVASFLFSLV